MDLRTIFTPASIAAQWEETASNRIAYLGAGLFPARQKAGLDLSWIRGYKGLPISLMPSAFDAKATFRDRVAVEKLETEMPFFREGFKIKEKDRQELLRVQDSNDPYAAQVIARLYDDANELLESAEVVAERERMQLLFAIGGDVGITIKANGVDYTYDYDPGDVWKGTNYFALSSTALWTANSTADPFANFETAKQAVQANTGSTPVYAIMNTYTFNLLGPMTSVRNRFLSTAGITTGYLTSGDVKRVMADTTGIQILVYDKQYRDEDKVAHKFVPDGYVALVPAGALGNTWRGTTPEEADLAGSGNARVAIVNSGVAITQIIDPHPVNVNTFASEIVLPSYERMNEVALLKVIA